MTWLLPLLTILAFLVSPAWAVPQNTGFLASTACKPVTVSGGQSWSDPTYGAVTSNTYARTTIGGSQGAPLKSYYLHCTGFDLSSLGNTDTFDSAEIRVERKASISGDIRIKVVKLTLDGSTLKGTSTPSGDLWGTTDADEDTAVTSPAITMAQAKASTSFGTILQIENIDTDEAATGYVDAVSLKIFYSGSGTATPTNTVTATRTNTPTFTKTSTPTKTATPAPTNTPYIGYEGDITVYAIPINTSMVRNATYRIGPPLADGDCVVQVQCAMNVDDASATWALGTTASDEAYLTDQALSSGIDAGVCVDATHPAGTPVFKIKAANVTTGSGTCWVTILRKKHPQPTPTATNTEIPG